MRRVVTGFTRVLFAVLLLGVLGFGAAEALAPVGTGTQDCPEVCFNNQECRDCCGTEESICPRPGLGTCLCA